MKIESLQPGTHYSNQDLCKIFLCAPQGGMRRSYRTNTLVLIANHTKSIYKDRWENGVLKYTGMGQIGDQSLHGNQNITLFESDTNGVEVHLFEVFKKRIYTYKGQVQLSEKPYEEVQDDQDDWPRTVWIFPLKVVGTVATENIPDKNLNNNESKHIENAYLDIQISDLECTVRTRNTMKASNIQTIRDLIGFSEYELMSIPNFGKKCLKEIKQILLELELGLDPTIRPPKTLRPAKKAFEDFDLSILEKYYNVPVSSLMELTVRTRNCLKKYSLGDLLESSKDDLMSIPNFGKFCLKEVKQSLSKLISRLEKNPLSDNFFEIDDSSFEKYFGSLKSHIGEREFGVLADRFGFYNQPKTLEEVGDKMDITRERVRQLEDKAKKTVVFIDFIKLVNKKLFIIRENLLIPLYLDHLPTYDPWFNLLTKKPWILKSILFYDKNSSHKVEKIDDEEIIILGANESLSEFITHLKHQLDENIRENYSKKDLKDYIKLLKPDMANEITSFVIQKLDHYKFTENSDDSQSYLVSFGRGVLPAALAILESSDKPLKATEMFQKLGYSTPSLQRNCTNQMTDSKKVFIFGRSLYGLKKHLELSDTKIDLINSQIKVHILENGPNKQWHCNELINDINFIDEIKEKLDGYKLSICVRLSDEFNYLGRFVFVLAGSQNTKVEKKDFSQMAMDVLLKSKKPLSLPEIKSIIIKDRSLSKHVQLHSRGRLIALRCFPKNVLKTKWALVDKHLNLSRDDIIELVNEMLPLIKQHENILTAENAIQAIKNNNVLNRFEDMVLTLFDLCENNINFIVKNDTLYHVDADIPNLSQENCLQKIAAKVNSKGIKKKDLMNQANQLYGKKVQYNTASRLTKFGFIYDTEEDIWYKGELIGNWQ